MKWFYLSTALALSAAFPRIAEACGGLFCNGQQPVVQTGEKIIFTIDRPEQIVHAIINVAYQGPPSEFAWVLPLQSAPTEINVAPSSVFTTVDTFTAPQFPVTVETHGVCADPNFDAFGGQDSLAVAPQAGENVHVISQQQVGPYETVVLASNDPNELRTWLTDHGYAVTETMINIVKPYLETGDVLVALKLRKDKDTGDIQPIAVTMSGTDVCVPIRLTAIAALENMDITAVVLSNEGRAIPKNYFHVPLNLAKIDWTAGGSNYRKIVQEAADEGSGNAFTTEFAGSARIFDKQIYKVDLYDRTKLESITSLQAFVAELQRQQLFNNVEMNDIFQQFFDVDLSNGFFSVPDQTIDAHEAVGAIWDRIVSLEIATQQLFDKYAYVTRLYTLISPEEMNLDPEFSFRSDLPDVTNVHRAKVILDCGLGGERRDAQVTIEIEETGQVIEFESNTGGDRSVLDSMPASTSVEQLEERRMVKDNAQQIAELLDQHNARFGHGCGCNFGGGRTKSKATEALATLTAIALGVFVLRRRKVRS